MGESLSTGLLRYANSCRYYAVCDTRLYRYGRTNIQHVRIGYCAADQSGTASSHVRVSQSRDRVQSARVTSSSPREYSRNKQHHGGGPVSSWCGSTRCESTQRQFQDGCAHKWNATREGSPVSSHRCTVALANCRLAHTEFAGCSCGEKIRPSASPQGLGSQGGLVSDSSLRTLNTPSNPGVSQTHGSDKVMLNRTPGAFLW